MSAISPRRFVSLLLGALVIVGVAILFVVATRTESVATEQVTSRLAGTDRIGTAIQIAQRGFADGADVAYLARADDPVDANVAGTLTDGPILLVPSCDPLPAAVGTELRRLAPDQIIALGGETAICDDLLDDAAAALMATEAQPSDVLVTATAIILDADGEPVDPSTVPYTVDMTDPGRVSEGDEVDHQLAFTGTGDDIVLDDPRFSQVLTPVDGRPGRLVIGRDGCGANLRGDEVELICTGDFQYLEVTDGERSAVNARIITDDEQVGTTPLAPGRYTFDHLVRWADEATPDDFSDGNLIRITYMVTS